VLSETEKAYLAGLIDGDGCINIGCHMIPGGVTPTHYLQVVIAQANRPFLEKWCAKTGFGTVYRTSGSKLSKKKMYNWMMSGRKAETFLQFISPYLDIKLDDAKIALMFRKTKHGRAGRRSTPNAIVNLREQYKIMLQEVKRNRGEPVEKPSEIEEYEHLVNSQLSLFQCENI